MRQLLLGLSFLSSPITKHIPVHVHAVPDSLICSNPAKWANLEVQIVQSDYRMTAQAVAAEDSLVLVSIARTTDRSTLLQEPICSDLPSLRSLPLKGLTFSVSLRSILANMKWKCLFFYFVPLWNLPRTFSFSGSQELSDLTIMASMCASV